MSVAFFWQLLLPWPLFSVCGVYVALFVGLRQWSTGTDFVQRCSLLAHELSSHVLALCSLSYCGIVNMCVGFRRSLSILPRCGVACLGPSTEPSGSSVTGDL